MDQPRAAISAKKREEEKLLEKRTASFARDRISTTSIIVFGDPIALAFLLSAFTALVGEIFSQPTRFSRLPYSFAAAFSAAGQESRITWAP